MSLPTPNNNYVRITTIPAERVKDVWDFILPGLERALDKSHNQINADDVKRNLVHNNWTLWVLSNDDNELTGIVVLEPIYTRPGLWVNIAFAWMRDADDDSLYTLVYPRLEKLCEEENLIGIKYISSRPGFQKVAEKMGFKPRYIEYIKEINQEEQ